MQNMVRNRYVETKNRPTIHAQKNTAVRPCFLPFFVNKDSLVSLCVLYLFNVSFDLRTHPWSPRNCPPKILFRLGVFASVKKNISAVRVGLGKSSVELDRLCQILHSGVVIRKYHPQSSSAK